MRIFNPAFDHHTYICYLYDTGVYNYVLNFEFFRILCAPFIGNYEGNNIEINYTIMELLILIIHLSS